jgi:hypothetical protein
MTAWDISSELCISSGEKDVFKPRNLGVTTGEVLAAEAFFLPPEAFILGEEVGSNGKERVQKRC